MTDKPEQCGAARTTTSDGEGEALCPCGNYAAPHPFPGCPTPGPVRKAKLEGPGADVQFGSADCTCIPWTRQDGPPRYCGPHDTVDMIGGWQRGRDCPPHSPAPEPCVHPAGYEGECPCKPSCGCCTVTAVAPAPEPGLREQYAAAIRYWWDDDDQGAAEIADAVLNVRDAELQQLRATLREVLDTFARVTAPPNPNALGYQGASIAPADFERWQAALDQPQEQP